MNPFLVWAAWADAVMRMNMAFFPGAAITQVLMQPILHQRGAGNICAPRGSHKR